MAQKQRKTQEQIIQEFKKVHKNKFDYSKVIYKNVHEKIEIICYQHGSFYQTSHDHRRGQGCPHCWNQKINKEQP